MPLSTEQFKSAKYDLYLKEQLNIPVLLYNMGLIYLNHLHNAAAAEPYFKLCVDSNKRNQHICKLRNFDETHLNKFKDIVLQKLIDNKMPSNFNLEVLIKTASKFEKPGYVREIFISNICEPNNRIRVGYMYRDCSSHPTSQLVKSIRKLHDRTHFEVFCYSLSPLNRFRSNYLSVFDISNLSSSDAAKKIKADGVHILIDVGDSTKHPEYEILVLRPAPIQVKLLGSPVTNVASYLDYLITDKYCCPPEELDYFYTEKFAYLDRTVFFGDHNLLFNDLIQRKTQNRTTNTNNSNETMGVIESYNTKSIYSVQILPDNSIKYYTRQMYNLPEDSIVYCYFGKFDKINDDTLSMWGDILKGVKNSVLWLLWSSNDATNNIHSFFVLYGVNPARVIFSNVVPKDEHLRRIQLADIFLDTPFHNGHTSCLDALWTGTPVVTLSGDTFATRMATSQLAALDCFEMMADTEDHYIRISIKLGTFPNMLDKLRQNIWQAKTTSVLFDCKSYCNQLENLYFDMWRNHNN